MWWRRNTPVAALTVAVLLTSVPAYAQRTQNHDCTGGAGIKGAGGEAGGECEESPPPPGRGQVCDPASRDVAFYGDPPEEEQERYVTIMARQPSPPEGMMWAAAYNCDGVYLGGPHLVPDPDWADIAGVRDRAQARLTPPLPAPSISPPEAVVNTATWLWVDDPAWEPVSASASQGAVAVRVEARPVEMTWDLDEGTRVCEGPGVPWSEDAQTDYERQPENVRGRGSPACTFTFVHSSSVTDDGLYHGSVTVTWEFAWWLNGVAQGAFGSVDRTTDFDLRVGEVQALITNYG